MVIARILIKQWDQEVIGWELWCRILKPSMCEFCAMIYKDYSNSVSGELSNVWDIFSSYSSTDIQCEVILLIMKDLRATNIQYFL